jgi:predicted amidohydrolase
MNLALAQVAVEPAAVETNVERALDRVAEAADLGADLVALPEVFDVGYFAFDRYDDAAAGLDDHETLDRLAAAAADHGVAVLAGSVVEDLAASRDAGLETPRPAGLANTAVLFDRSGERRLVYRKRHLFGYGSAESDLLVPGESLSTVDLGEHVLGVTTCYDLRFPELYRELADRGVTLVVVPSAWPYPRVEHWRLLPKARAVENLCYVAPVNGVGTFQDAELLGRSAVYDPWGTTLASAGDEPATVTADVSRERVDSVRAEFPALEDRRSGRP